MGCIEYFDDGFCLISFTYGGFAIQLVGGQPDNSS